MDITADNVVELSQAAHRMAFSNVLDACICFMDGNHDALEDAAQFLTLYALASV